MADTPSTYEEPWQAELMATVFALQQHGVVAAKAMTDALASRRTADDVDDDRYFEDVLASLEEVLNATTAIDDAEIRQRVNAWRDAYIRTPHGKPVKLAADE